jgi:hypothetical protein
MRQMSNMSQCIDDRLELYYAKWKLAGYLFLSVLGAGLFLWASVIGYWVALLGTVFYGLGFVVMLPKLFDNKAQIIVDPKGIHDRRRQHWPKGVTIPWGDIQSIHLLHRKIGRFRQMHIVCIKFQNPEHYFQKMSLIHRWTQKLDRAAHYGIAGTGLTADGLEVFNYIQSQNQKGRISVPVVS